MFKIYPDWCILTWNILKRLGCGYGQGINKVKGEREGDRGGERHSKVNWGG